MEEERSYSDGTRVLDVVEELGIDQEEVGVLMINSRHCQFETHLKENDILAIFPVVGGG
jgi:sulfur carrier protein ThiS